MQRTVVYPMTKQQTTVSARVFGVIFDNFSVADHKSNIRRTDHALRPRHLLSSMRKKQDFYGSGLSKLLQDLCIRVHAGLF
jgi:hypothetical protein